jgi:AcrR family transcriptional regulator
VTNKVPRRGRRPPAESSRTQARLLDGAERLFARKGYRGVSVRELARAGGVRPFTVQHHFGSKLGLYRAVLSRWDGEVLARISRTLSEGGEFPTLVRRVVHELFDFFLARRDWVALNARAVLGEGLPRGVTLEDRSWVRFMEEALRGRDLDPSRVDLGLLLITIEGLLNHHVLSATHYRHLFGRDVTDPVLRRRAKAHLEGAILALLGPVTGSERPPRPRGARVGRSS